MTFCVVGVALIAALVSCQVRSGQAVNPGFRTILTQRGLDYGNESNLLILNIIHRHHIYESIFKNVMQAGN